MCKTKKIVAITLFAAIAAIGIFGISGNQSNIANAQTNATSSSLSIAQLERMVEILKQQITIILALIQQQYQNCAKEGEKIYTSSLANGRPVKCCSGLTAISSCTASGDCPNDGSSTCAYCGNGKCGAGENSYNCPKDCSEKKDICSRALSGSPTNNEQTECTQAGGTIYCGNGWCVCHCEEKTCSAICKSLGYEKSKCNKYAVTPEANICPEGYINSNRSASDCKTDPDIVGAGKACCCANLITACAKEGKYSSGAVSADYARNCCSGLSGFETHPGSTGSGLLCYDSTKGTPVCKNTGSKSEGWYYPNGTLLRWEICSQTAVCAKEGEIFTDDERECCKGLERIEIKEECTGEQSCAQVISYTCQKQSCAKEGELKYPDWKDNKDRPHECCYGLTAVTNCNENGECVNNGTSRCVYCGNGECGKGENKVNCPKDCDDNGKAKCIATGGKWGYSECMGCVPKTKKDRISGDKTCSAVCVPDYECACPTGKYWGSYEEGCIKYEIPCITEGQIFETNDRYCCSGLIAERYCNENGECKKAWICKKPTKLTCAQACEEKGYSQSNCIYSSEGGCKSGQYNAGWTSDCAARETNDTESIWGGWACCCSACAKEGETIYSSGKKCCEGLTPIGKCSDTANCDADSWVCSKVTSCAKEGERIMPGDGKSCCSGLSKMPFTSGDGKTCTITSGYICTAFCGDGICGWPFDCSPETDCEGTSYENACSCPKDCPATACAEEGEKIYSASLANGRPTQCCSGLTAISSCTASGACPNDGSSTCAYCGNGKCGAGENSYNCPKDCPATACAEEGEIFTDANRECCEGLVRRSLETDSTCSLDSDCTSPSEIRYTCEKYVKPCVGEGGRWYPESECCSGLSLVYIQGVNDDGTCGKTTDAMRCTKCGDGICGTGENKCNCSNDCKEIPSVGGNCTYKSYSGTCSVSSVTDQGSNSSALVKFRFAPSLSMDLSNTFITSPSEIISKTYQESASYLGLSCAGSIYPVTAAKAKLHCNLQAGSTFKCTLKLIAKGTCTPTVFVFE